jgi:hypothetical protein
VILLHGLGEGRDSMRPLAEHLRATIDAAVVSFGYASVTAMHDDLAPHYDAMYDDLYGDAFHAATDGLLRLLQGLCAPPARVLDVGAGTGHRHYGCVIGASGAIDSKAAKISTPEFRRESLGLQDQRWADAVWVITGKYWNVPIDDRSG